MWRTETGPPQSCLDNYLEINLLLVPGRFSAFTMQSFSQGVEGRVIGSVRLAGGGAVSLDGGPGGPGGDAQGLGELSSSLHVVFLPTPQVSEPPDFPIWLHGALREDTASYCAWSLGFACVKVCIRKMWREGIREPALGNPSESLCCQLKCLPQRRGLLILDAS